MTCMEVFLQVLRLTLLAPHRAMTALSAAVAGTTSPSARRFATGTTAAWTPGTRKWASAFVAPPIRVGCICKEIIKNFHIRGGFESLNHRVFFAMQVVSTGSTTAWEP